MHANLTKPTNRAAVLVDLYASETAGHGHLVTNDKEFGKSSTITFDSFGSFQFTQGPVDIGREIDRKGITWSAENGSSVIGQGGYGLSSNGSWFGTFTGTNSSDSAMTFDFGGLLLRAVGGFVNYAPGNGFDATMQTLDSKGNILGTFDLEKLAPIFTPGATNEGAFRGIVDEVADIAALRVFGDFFVLDNLTGSR